MRRAPICYAEAINDAYAVRRCPSARGLLSSMIGLRAMTQPSCQSRISHHWGRAGQRETGENSLQ